MQYNNRNSEAQALKRVRSPRRHDEGMDELQKFLDFKPVELVT